MEDYNRITQLISMSMEGQLSEEKQIELEQRLASDPRARLIHSMLINFRQMFRGRACVDAPMPTESKRRLQARIEDTLWS